MVTNSYPPVITTQPTNQVVTNGAIVNFSVSATGDALFYQWQFNGTNISGATNMTFALANVQVADSGNYTVIISNSVGITLSSAASLNLLPFITAQPQSRTVLIGDSVTFNVTAGGSGTLNYIWHFNGSVVGGNASSYSKSSVQTNDAGNYYVTVGNSFGTIDSATATLTVNSAAPAAIRLSLPKSESASLNLNPIALSYVSVRDGRFTFAFPSSPNVSYETQYKDDLTDPNWIPLMTNISAGEWLTNEVAATNEPSRFFRVIAK
jgi:hypothetical protein